MGDLQGKIALVTGGSRGIGRAISERLASDGAMVAVHHGGNVEAANATAAAITERGGAAFVVGERLGSHGDAVRLFAQLDHALEARTGTREFDILVNNAGVAGPSSLADTDEEFFDQLMGVNARAPFFLSTAAVERLRRGGRIVTLTTGLTRVADPSLAAYAMSKAPVDVMTLSLAKELGRSDITINAVAPGVIDTDMNAGWLRASDEARATVAAMSPFGRLGTVEDVADIVAFAVSEDARWMTGQYLDATGGAML